MRGYLPSAFRAPCDAWALRQPFLALRLPPAGNKVVVDWGQFGTYDMTLEDEGKTMKGCYRGCTSPRPAAVLCPTHPRQECPVVGPLARSRGPGLATGFCHSRSSSACGIRVRSVRALRHADPDDWRTATFTKAFTEEEVAAHKKEGGCGHHHDADEKDGA